MFISYNGSMAQDRHQIRADSQHTSCNSEHFSPERYPGAIFYAKLHTTFCNTHRRRKAEQAKKLLGETSKVIIELHSLSLFFIFYFFFFFFFKCEF